MKTKDFIQFHYPIIAESSQFYLSIRKAQILPPDSLNRNRAGTKENLRLSCRSDVRMLLNR